MAVSVTCTAVVKESLPSTRVRVRFDDGSELEFATMAALQTWVRELDDPSNTQTAQRLLIGWWLARSSDGANVALVEGKKLTFDLTSASAIKVQ